jgi:hypothetical protein
MLRVALTLLALATALGGCGAAGTAAVVHSRSQVAPRPHTVAQQPAARVQRSKPDRFNEPAAWRLIRIQVRVGQRPAGSPQLRRLAVRLRGLLPNGHFEPIPGDPRLRNVVGTLPGASPAIVIGAHYDTLVKPRGFVGANNGAAGTAIVVQLARDLRKLHRPRSAPAIRFVLFDGEEPPAGLPEDTSDFYDTGLRGSRTYVAEHPGEVGEMVLLDYVAGRDEVLPREANSSPSLWTRIRSAATAVGAGPMFPDATGYSITDDHTPFLRAGIPAVDLIDWNYPGHSLQDGVRLLSHRSVDAVGETIAQFLLAQH